MVSALKISKIGYSRSNQLDIANYEQAEKYLNSLFKHNSDQILAHSSQTKFLENTISEAISKAFAAVLSASDRRTPGSHLAHRFLQRVLYQINCRLSHLNAGHSEFYKDKYRVYFTGLQNQIESIWQRWELAQFDFAALQEVSVEQALIHRVEADSSLISAENARFFRTQMTQAGYRRLLAIAPLDGLAAISHLCRTLNATSKDHSTPTEFTRLFLQRNYLNPLNRQYSTYFIKMIAALDMDTKLEVSVDRKLAKKGVVSGQTH